MHEEVVRALLNLSESMTRPVYRGQAKASWELRSGALRRLQDAYGEDFPRDEIELHNLVDRYHREQLILPMTVIDGSELSDLQRLSVLQHQGAATGLLDFTELPLVALWFACAEYPDEDGHVFVLDIGDREVAQNARQLSDPFSTEQVAVYYEPDRSLGARIIAQQSVFVIGNPHVLDRFVKSVLVPQQSKKRLRDYLKGLGLSETVLFGDVPGLAAANTVHTRLPIKGALSPGQYRDRGNRAYQEGRFDEALVAYESYVAALPDVAQPHCLKGDALAALGRFEEAYLAYTSAIENLDRPIFLGEQVIVNPEIANMMSRSLYYNRGNMRAASGGHEGAVVDFDIALQHGVGSKMSVLCNRGNSKFALEMFEEAHEDFEAAWVEQEQSSAALAMGNCKVMMGEFEEALPRYLTGSSVEPEGSAAGCRQSAEQVQRLLQTLSGNDFQVRREGLMVYVEAEGLAGQFPFTGNQGNTGNIPSGLVGAQTGGKGYEGLMGCVVGIVSP